MTSVGRFGGGGAYHADFTLSITKALGDQLADALAQLDRVPLTEAAIDRLKDKPGVYQLYLNGEFVYVGKAESLPARLRNHKRKIGGRRGISLDGMTFSCLYVAEDFSALAPEQLLINHHKGIGQIPWNNNGFGNKDPGRNRDGTVLRANHFDVVYPIDLERQVKELSPGRITLHGFLELVKARLPYNFRYQRAAPFRSQWVDIPNQNVTADAAFSLIASKLSEPWQIVALMGYVIMYPDGYRKYPSAWRYYRVSETDDVVPEVQPAGPVEEPDELDFET